MTQEFFNASDALFAEAKQKFVEASNHGNLAKVFKLFQDTKALALFGIKKDFDQYQANSLADYRAEKKSFDEVCVDLYNYLNANISVALKLEQSGFKAKYPELSLYAQKNYQEVQELSSLKLSSLDENPNERLVINLTRLARFMSDLKSNVLIAKAKNPIKAKNPNAKPVKPTTKYQPSLATIQEERPLHERKQEIADLRTELHAAIKKYPTSDELQEVEKSFSLACDEFEKSTAGFNKIVQHRVVIDSIFKHSGLDSVKGKFESILSTLDAANPKHHGLH